MAKIRFPGNATQNRVSPMIRRINFLKYVEKRDNPYSYKLFKIKKRLQLKKWENRTFSDTEVVNHSCLNGRVYFKMRCWWNTWAIRRTKRDKYRYSFKCILVLMSYSPDKYHGNFKYHDLFRPAEFDFWMYALDELGKSKLMLYNG